MVAQMLEKRWAISPEFERPLAMDLDGLPPCGVGQGAYDSVGSGGHVCNLCQFAE